MTLAERCQLARADEQMQGALELDDARVPRMRRIECQCGCGRWWHALRAAHRPRAYATDDCRRREHARRQQTHHAARRTP